MSRHQIHVATSHTVAHVATSNPCRDTVFAHSGISRSRRQKPGRDLPHCYPCRDLKNDVATSTQLSPISATSRRHFSMLRPPLLPPMSRHQYQLAKILGRHPETYCNPARSRRHFLAATSHPTKPGRDLTSNQTRSRPQILVVTSTGPNPQRFFFFIQ